ncbi:MULTISPECIES: replication initiation protein [Spirosoma]|uniref:Replication initiation protein n=1 Tax=Spirosoma liriopis TaxID=2937440 RepID=A0ABT0HW79_9BACT|nr:MULTISPECIES: replication initiation protein [Spirosoma]MCK8495863.1 replication initiation protein [Spirosoma liriopis]UHG94987.1 replication initiation protein [Spirosoma oryzicola]
MNKKAPENQLSLLTYFEGSQVLFQGNDLTSAQYEMSEVQKNIFYMVQSQLGADDAPDKQYTLRVRDIMGLKGNTNMYTSLREATKTMMQKILTIKLKDGYLQVAPFSSVLYNTKEGTLSIRIDPSLRPYLFNLKTRFTTFGHTEALTLSGKYTKRIYEMLSQWKHMKLMKITVRELKTRLALYDPETDQEQYPSWDGFRRRVLLQAIEEINEKTDLHVKMYPEREGRKVAILKWTIAITRTHAISPTPSDLQIRLTTEFGLRPDQAERITEQYDVPFIYKKLYEIRLSNNKETIANIGAYTATVFNVK